VGAFPDYSGADGGGAPPDRQAQFRGQVQRMMRLVAKMFLLLGLVVLGEGAYLAWTEWNANRSWPVVTGVVTKCQLVDEPGDEDSPSVYNASLEFHYEVQGKNYLGNTGFSWASNDRSIMESKRRQYAIGSSHPIHYNPANPAQVQLEAETTARSFAPAWVGVGIGLCMVFVGLCALFADPEKQPFLKRKPPEGF